MCQIFLPKSAAQVPLSSGHGQAAGRYSLRPFWTAAPAWQEGWNWHTSTEGASTVHMGKCRAAGGLFRNASNILSADVGEYAFFFNFACAYRAASVGLLPRGMLRTGRGVPPCWHTCRTGRARVRQQGRLPMVARTLPSGSERGGAATAKDKAGQPFADALPTAGTRRAAEDAAGGRETEMRTLTLILIETTE